MVEFMESLISSASYSIFGFLAGFVLGWETKSLKEKREMRDNEPHDNPSATHKKPRYGTVGVFLVLLALFTSVQIAYYNFQQKQATECLSDYNESLAEAQRLRAKWADDDRQALLAFFMVYDYDSSVQQREGAFRTLIETYERNSANREETPLPRLHECG